MNDAEKPLFIPLKAKYFDAFASGDKDTEWRNYGPRWNEATCREGRRVILSRGYGKQSRLAGVVVGFEKREGVETPARVIELLPSTRFYAAIKIKLDPKP